MYLEVYTTAEYKMWVSNTQPNVRYLLLRKPDHYSFCAGIVLFKLVPQYYYVYKHSYKIVIPALSAVFVTGSRSV